MSCETDIVITKSCYDEHLISICVITSKDLREAPVFIFDIVGEILHTKINIFKGGLFYDQEGSRRVFEQPFFCRS